jgi:hypothetical protein
MAQNLVVAVLVGGCFLQALWALAPKAACDRMAIALLKLPLPKMLQKCLLSAARQQGGCGGCDGCGSGSLKLGKAPEAHQPLVFMPQALSILGSKREGNQ